jgi:uncharacterized protein (DUF1800 family)
MQKYDTQKVPTQRQFEKWKARKGTSTRYISPKGFRIRKEFFVEEDIVVSLTRSKYAAKRPVARRSTISMCSKKLDDTPM